MNKEKLIEKINNEINSIVESLPKTTDSQLDKVINGSLRFGLYCYQKALEIIQSEDETNGWIPVSERLPKDTGYYQITNEAERVEYLWYKSSERKWYLFNSDIEHHHVIAWQPLPEPYKAGD